MLSIVTYRLKLLWEIYVLHCCSSGEAFSEARHIQMLGDCMTSRGAVGTQICGEFGGAGALLPHKSCKMLSQTLVQQSQTLHLSLFLLPKMVWKRGFFSAAVGRCDFSRGLGHQSLRYQSHENLRIDAACHQLKIPSILIIQIYIVIGVERTGLECLIR